MYISTLICLFRGAKFKIQNPLRFLDFFSVGIIYIMRPDPRDCSEPIFYLAYRGGAGATIGGDHQNLLGRIARTAVRYWCRQRQPQGARTTPKYFETHVWKQIMTKSMLVVG